MAGWILLSLAPLLLGLFMATQNRPENKGKKKALRAFTIAYPQKVVNCVVVTVVLMVGVVALNAYMDPALLSELSVYYTFYAMGVGLVAVLAVMLGRRAVSFDGDKIEVYKGLFGKPEVFAAGDLAGLDIQKTAVRALKADGTVMFTAGVMMENLDLFFAWTHERPGIKLTMDGKELPQKGAPKDPTRKPN